MESGGVPQQAQPAPQVVAQAHQQQALAQIYGQAFLHLQETQLAEMQWRLELSAKLAAMLETLRERNQATANICLCQTWLGADGCEVQNPNSLEVTLWADPRLGFVLDPLFQELRVKSCQGPVFFRNSMPGKVWRSGAVQIVQNLRILPPTLHPRSQLSEEALERLAEALYIPIYDLARPLKGQVCVLEVLLSTRATEAMLVADVISFIGSLLTALHLSLANPIQPPIRRSVLCGRRARAPDSDGEGSDGERPGPARGAGSAGAAAAPQPPLPPPAGGAAGQAGGSGAAPASMQQQAGGVGSGAPATAAAVQAAGVVACGAAVVAAAAGAAARGCCPGTGPATSEQPTLPASPSPERLTRVSETAAGAAGGHSAAQAAAGQAAAGARTEPGPPPQQQDDGAAVSALHMPRKVRKVLDGAMQRSKSVVSVAALSHGMRDEDEEEEEGAEERQAAAAAAAARTAGAASAAAAADATGAAVAAAAASGTEQAGTGVQPTAKPNGADT